LSWNVPVICHDQAASQNRKEFAVVIPTINPSVTFLIVVGHCARRTFSSQRAPARRADPSRLWTDQLCKQGVVGSNPIVSTS
jgi:hypothetical protein